MDSPSPLEFNPPDPFKGGQYEYMEELRILGRRSPPAGHCRLPVPFARIISPLKAEVWEVHLRALPDRECADYLLRGLGEGFRIGYDYDNYNCHSARSNMLSALQNPHVVDEYMREEREKGRILGPVNPGSCNLQVNRFGVIPKGHQTGKWRLILDLSHPEGSSVNDGINPSLCSLSYTSVDWAVRLVLAMGRGAELAKLDLESA